MPDKDWEICFSKFDNTSSERSHVARCSRAVRVTVSECCQSHLYDKTSPADIRRTFVKAERRVG